MAKQIIDTPSHDITEYDLLPRHISRDNKPETIDLSAPLRRYTRGNEEHEYRIQVAILPAVMQCTSGTPDNIASNLAMYNFSGVAGPVNCTQPKERQLAVVRRLKESGARIIPAAINTHDYEERVPALVKAGANLIIVDTSQGFSDYQKETIDFTKGGYPYLPVVGGNIATPDGFVFLADKCKADVAKVGYGVGAGCITGDVLGVARRQGTAIRKVAEARDDFYKTTDTYVPIIADGGIKTFSDIPKAYALGADIVMVGRLIAGADETPNPLFTVRFLRNGNVAYEGLAKEFWYEASDRARLLAQGPIRDYSYRYEEGKEGWVKGVGPLTEFLSMGFVKIRDAIRKAGYRSIPDMHENAELELANRAVDSNDPDIAIWDHKDVKVLIEDEWMPSGELQKYMMERRN